MSLLPEVREEMVAAAARIARSPRRRVRFARGGFSMALGVGVAVAVAAVAVLGLRHRAPAPPSSGPAGPGVAALEAKLAILRRPQTPAERAYGRGFPHSTVIQELTRSATTIPTGAGRVHVYLLVLRLGRAKVPFVVANAVDRQHRTLGGSRPASASMLTPGSVGAGEQIRGRGLDPNRGIAVSVVPDGVVRVKWVFTGAAFGVLNPHPLTVYPAVKNNVAVATVIPDQGPLARAVWYGADGRVVASADGGAVAKQGLRQIQAVNASRNRPIARELIAHYRLFRTVAPVDLARNPVLPTAGGGPGDLNYWQTRYIGSVAGLDGRGLWVTPGTRDVCISDWNAGSCTAPLSRRDDAGILGGSTSDGRETTFVGLVPDGNPTVTVVLAGGARRTFPVTDNVYEITARGRVTAIIDRDIHGRVVRTPLGG